MSEYPGADLQDRVAPLFTFAFFALCAACISIGWLERLTHLDYAFPAGKLFISIVGGPCQTFEVFAYGRDEPATELFLATPTLIALGSHMTWPSRGRAVLCCVGIAWWFMWGFAISHIGV